MKKDPQEIKRARYWFVLFILVWMIMIVSTQDYETEVMENKHWCDLVEQGIWGASHYEYLRRCSNVE